MKAIRRHIETCASGGERRKENANLLLKSKASLVLCISSNYRSTGLVVLYSVFHKDACGNRVLVILCFRKDACGNRVLIIFCFHKDVCENGVLFFGV